MADFREVITKLLERTDQDKISWRPTVTANTFVAVIGEWSVSISAQNYPARAARVRVRVHDQAGQIIEDFSTNSSDDFTNCQMHSLHKKAKLSALGNDCQLDELLRELDKV